MTLPLIDAIRCAGPDCSRCVDSRTGEAVKITNPRVRIVGADYCPDCRNASTERVLAEVNAVRHAWREEDARNGIAWRDEKGGGV